MSNKNSPTLSNGGIWMYIMVNNNIAVRNTIMIHLTLKREKLGKAKLISSTQEDKIAKWK